MGPCVPLFVILQAYNVHVKADLNIAIVCLIGGLAAYTVSAPGKHCLILLR